MPSLNLTNCNNKTDLMDDDVFVIDDSDDD